MMILPAGKIGRTAPRQDILNINNNNNSNDKEIMIIISVSSIIVSSSSSSSRIIILLSLHVNNISTMYTSIIAYVLCVYYV